MKKFFSVGLAVSLAVALLSVTFVASVRSSSDPSRWTYGKFNEVDHYGMWGKEKVYDPEIDESGDLELIESFYIWYDYSDWNMFEVGWEDNEWNSGPTWFVAWCKNGDYGQEVFGSANVGSNPYLTLMNVVTEYPPRRTYNWAAAVNNDKLLEMTLYFNVATNSVCLSEVSEFSTPFENPVDGHKQDLYYFLIHSFAGLIYYHWYDSTAHDDPPYYCDKVSDTEFTTEGPI